MAVRKSW